MVEVTIPEEGTEVYDECWSCGKTLGEGSLVVEIQLLKVSKAVLAIVHLPASLGSNVYYRSCLSCALGRYKTYTDELAQRDALGKEYNCLPGINGDNLNACYMDWKSDLPEGNPWMEYPQAEY